MGRGMRIVATARRGRCRRRRSRGGRLSPPDGVVDEPDEPAAVGVGRVAPRRATTTKSPGASGAEGCGARVRDSTRSCRPIVSSPVVHDERGAPSDRVRRCGRSVEAVGSSTSRSMVPASGCSVQRSSDGVSAMSDDGVARAGGCGRDAARLAPVVVHVVRAIAVAWCDAGHAVGEEDEVVAADREALDRGRRIDDGSDAAGERPGGDHDVRLGRRPRRRRRDAARRSPASYVGHAATRATLARRDRPGAACRTRWSADAPRRVVAVDEDRAFEGDEILDGRGRADVVSAGTTTRPLSK